MQSVHKVEIIISSQKLERVLKILEKVGVSGYTVIDNTTGKGDRGFTDIDLDRVFSNAYILTVCTNEKQLNFLTEEIKPLLKKVGGICLVTEAAWINH
ncbi:MAG: P-II family nitrogen regulator [Pleurocapsa minor HA4230-MV1]|jgi:nitrogen regulatory protein PII|nr:P-II family nitrogen regulator [Pleurocapsa minor HA4230-MV1]